MKTPRPRRSPAVAFQGERGAFSEQAVRQLLGPSATVLPCVRFEDIFRNLKQGSVAGAVVPIENTLAGSVHENYDHLLHFELPIVAETSVRIVHNLIAPKGVAFRQIKRVFSHPVALNQCLDFFLANPQIERIPYYDTAGSAKMVVEEGLTDVGRHRLRGGRGDLWGAHFAQIDRKRPAELHPVLPAANARVCPAPPASACHPERSGRPRWCSARAIFRGRCFAR